MITKTESQSPLTICADRHSMQRQTFYDTLKKSIAPGLTDDELCAFCIISNMHGLDMLTKQIQAFKGSNGRLVYCVTVDGWIKIMTTHPNLDGMTFKTVHDEVLGTGIECTIHIKERKYPVSVTEWLNECKRETTPWKQMPMRMLRHKALIQCARVAFGISGIHDPDEARDILKSYNPEKEQVQKSTVIEAQVIEQKPIKTTILCEQLVDMCLKNKITTEQILQYINQDEFTPYHSETLQQVPDHILKTVIEYFEDISEKILTDTVKF
jgi:hypothetical protein